MARDLRCAGYPGPAAHPGRVAEAGFQNVVITRNDLPPGALVPDPDGRLCGACHAAKLADDLGTGNVRKTMIANIRAKLRTNPVPQFTVAETMLIIKNLFRDDDDS